MKKFIAMMLVCILMLSAIVPMAAYATDGDFTGSVEQKGDDTSPKTGDMFSILPAAGSVMFALSAGACFAAGKKKEN